MADSTVGEPVLVIGATSGIGAAIARELARAGRPLALAARNAEQLERLAQDLRVRNEAEVSTHHFEALDFPSHAGLISEAAAGGRLAGVVCSHGYMAEQGESERDFSLAQRMIDVNYTATVSVLLSAATHLREAGGGYICALSSVAGDRGRGSNYLYGSSKAGVSAFLQGLRNSLFASGVHVLTVKPGFVDTAMTWGVLDPESPMVASPERVARNVVRAIERRKNVLYTPRWWWGIMAVIRAIPEPLFKRLSL
jgi:short-subunit dehydrogenase